MRTDQSDSYRMCQYCSEFNAAYNELIITVSGLPNALDRFVLNIFGGRRTGERGRFRAVLYPRKFRKFIMLNRAFWGLGIDYLCDNWSTEWVHFVLLSVEY